MLGRNIIRHKHALRHQRQWLGNKATHRYFKQLQQPKNILLRSQHLRNFICSSTLLNDHTKRFFSSGVEAQHVEDARIECPRPMRNVAVIAHVDHGKTTLVDKLLQQSGLQDLAERAMDWNTLEQERGITILSKVTSFEWEENNILYNIVDTPGHADFGGEVERVLSMVDGVLLIVDAQEGPMAQTKYVLTKALAKGLKPIVIFNKADRPDHRIGEVENEIFDLFINLGADENQLDFPILYASAKEGWVVEEPEEISDAVANGGTMAPVLRALAEHVPRPRILANADAPFSLLVTSIEPDQYVGRLVTGKITSGRVKIGDELKVLSRTGDVRTSSAKVIKIFARRGLQSITLEEAEAGDIIQLAGFPEAGPTDTVCACESEQPLFADPIDPPTIAMAFAVNDSPLGGKEGSFLTSAQIAKRLAKEAESNVSLRIVTSAQAQAQSEAGADEQGLSEIVDANAREGMVDAVEVQGRGELQLAVLIENMRREGYELSISPPRVVFKRNEDGKKVEPYEEVTLDIDEEFAGSIIEKMAHRKGELKDYTSHNGKARLIFEAPARGLIGFQSEFKTDTRGTGVMNRSFSRYSEYQPDLNKSAKGALISSTGGAVTAYAMRDLEARGILFVRPGDQVYTGMVVGEHTRENDLDVNPVRAKKLTNVRASGADEAIRLNPARIFSLEEAITYIGQDELLEVTPSALRIRKRVLDPSRRRVMKRRGE